MNALARNGHQKGAHKGRNGVDLMLPNSLEAEESVVGGILTYAKKLPEVRGLVEPQHFLHPACRAIYEAMIDLAEMDVPVDALTVFEQLKKQQREDMLRAFNGAEYLTELMAKVVTVENIGYHARIVHKKAIARAITLTAKEISARGYGDYGDVEEFLDFARTSIQALDNPRELEEPGFATMTIGSVPDTGGPEFLVSTMWLDKGVGLVAGDPKSLKSFFTVFVAVHIAADRPLFGTLKVKQGRVLLFNAEDTAQLTRHRIAGICRALDIDITTLDLHLVDTNALFLDEASHVEKLRRTIERMKPSLVILDPLRNLHGLDENDSKILPLVLAPLRLIQRDFDCAVQVVHHVIKATEGRTPQSRIRGTGALRGWYDSAWILDRQADRSVKVEVEHRGAEAPEPFAFRLEETMVRDGKAFWFEKGSVQEDGTAEEQIIAFKSSNPGASGREAIKQLKSRGVTFKDNFFWTVWRDA